MNIKRPDDINQAVELLKKFEKAEDHIHRTKYFKEAVYILNNHLSMNPNSSNKKFIENIKLTYTRKLLEQLSDLPLLDFESWFQYIYLFYFRIKDEVELDTKKYPNLEKNYKNFIALYGNELIKYLEEDLNI